MIEITKQEFWDKRPKLIKEKSINNISMAFYRNKDNEYFMIYRVFNMRHNYLVSLEYFEISYDEYVEETDDYENGTNRHYNSSDSFYRKRFNYGYDD